MIIFFIPLMVFPLCSSHRLAMDIAGTQPSIQFSFVSHCNIVDLQLCRVLLREIYPLISSLRYGEEVLFFFYLLICFSFFWIRACSKAGHLGFYCYLGVISCDVATNLIFLPLSNYWRSLGKKFGSDAVVCLFYHFFHGKFRCSPCFTFKLKRLNTHKMAYQPIKIFKYYRVV